MNKAFLKKIFQAHQECPACPSAQEVASFYRDLLSFLFPDFKRNDFRNEDEVARYLEDLRARFITLISFQTTLDVMSASDDFFSSLPGTQENISDDVHAMYNGDPAARSEKEVVRTYPGFYAIAAYRIAHRMLKLGIKEIPRMITEHAHSLTGIDIHPGAVIGSAFCIDHGTGIVIGETSVIGDRVKLYQGVTLGALSVNKEDAIRKRHPTIGDDVVIYAGATILGGDTVIGNGSVIGGNVWLTKSVPANSKIYYQSRMYNGQTEETDLIIFKHDRDKA